METNRRWTAEWIWTEAPNGNGSASREETETVYFRKTFNNPASGAKLTLRVSADSRYILYVNGRRVTAGPCKGDRMTHYYETLDVSDLLREGCNAICAKVVHYALHEPRRLGQAGPISVYRSQQGAFLLEGVVEPSDRSKPILLKTDDTWKCLRDTAVAHQRGEMGDYYLGYPEKVDGRLIPHGWERAGFDDTSWRFARPVSTTANAFTGELTPWNLTARPIPLLFETKRSFTDIVRTEGMDRQTAACLLERKPLDIPGNSTVVLELAAERLVTGYLRLESSGGADAVIQALCSECYEDPPDASGNRRKGVRDDSLGRLLYGDTDSYRVVGLPFDGGAGESYEPFMFRTFRYVRLTIVTSDEPLRLLGVHYRETGYPLEVRSSFECSNPDYGTLWEISLNTLRNCMHETYEDCPFYEQLQYTMDTMMQAVFTYQVSADDRLARRAIYDFHSSMLPNGMLQCRYPTIYPQVIPGFALYWIFMLRDHYWHYGDSELVVRYRPSMEMVLNWFDRQLTEDGIVGPAPEGYWSFVDWVEEWMDMWGVPTASRQGPITVYSLMYAAALQIAAWLNTATGRVEAAGEYVERADRVREAVRKRCWSVQRGLFRDGPEVEEYSQHTQIWAVLSETVSGEEALVLMRKTITDRSLSRVSFSMSYFLFRALSQSGLYRESYPLWSMWTEQVQLHLTSWMEDPVTQRSDCHAWGAIPLYEFPAEILGVKPAIPGFDAIRIAPQGGPLGWARGSVATRHGLVEVDWRITEDGAFTITVTGPARIPIEIVLPDGQIVCYEDTSLTVIVSCRVGTNSRAMLS